MLSLIKRLSVKKILHSVKENTYLYKCEKQETKMEMR